MKVRNFIPDNFYVLSFPEFITKNKEKLCSLPLDRFFQNLRMSRKTRATKKKNDGYYLREDLLTINNPFIF